MPKTMGCPAPISAFEDKTNENRDKRQKCNEHKQNGLESTQIEQDQINDDDDKRGIYVRQYELSFIECMESETKKNGHKQHKCDKHQMQVPGNGERD